MCHPKQNVYREQVDIGAAVAAAHLMMTIMMMMTMRRGFIRSHSHNIYNIIMIYWCWLIKKSALNKSTRDDKPIYPCNTENSNKWRRQLTWFESRWLKIGLSVHNNNITLNRMAERKRMWQTVYLLEKRKESNAKSLSLHSPAISSCLVKIDETLRMKKKQQRKYHQKR